MCVVLHWGHSSVGKVADILGANMWRRNMGNVKLSIFQEKRLSISVHRRVHITRQIGWNCKQIFTKTDTLAVL